VVSITSYGIACLFVMYYAGMSQYCNSKLLERNWFNWLLSSAVPGLESYRRCGLLFTKILGGVDGNKGLPDPCFPRRYHCLALPDKIYVESLGGRLFTPIRFSGRIASRVSYQTIF